MLQNKKWKEADLETKYIMLKFAGRIDQGWLDKSSLKNFPTKVIIKIDELWRQYSDERFGFATQKRIYLDTGNKLEQINKQIEDPSFWANKSNVEKFINFHKKKLRN